MMQLVITEADFDRDLTIAQNVIRIALQQLRTTKNVAEFVGKRENAIIKMKIRITKKTVPSRH